MVITGQLHLQTIRNLLDRLIFLQMYCYFKCSATLAHGAVGWYAECYCGICFIDVGHTYDGINVTALLSYTLSAKKDMQVDDKMEK